MDALCAVQGDRLVVLLGGVDRRVASPAARAVADLFGPGPVVVGPVVDDLGPRPPSAPAPRSRRTAPPPAGRTRRARCSADELLPERALAGDGHARRHLVDEVYLPLVNARGTLVETLAAYFDQGRRSRRPPGRSSATPTRSATGSARSPTSPASPPPTRATPSPSRSPWSSAASRGANERLRVEGRRYVELGLRLTRLDDGLLDSYFGPPDIAQAIEDEPVAEPADPGRRRGPAPRRAARRLAPRPGPRPAHGRGPARRGADLVRRRGRGLLRGAPASHRGGRARRGVRRARRAAARTGIRGGAVPRLGGRLARAGRDDRAADGGRHRGGARPHP